ncbi:PQQ-binding-like beta-propeller repeat protein [Halorussus sp. AFM4]|uniref:outer membrane protein assembly factor BamB family protein n=1 Tax=Halorussus sp. AFM4 TaxID=3421651 RepID=UPI003EB94F69
MRVRTVAGVLLVVLVLGSVFGYSLVREESTRTLTAEWVSTPPWSLESNHHSPTGVTVDGETFVAVPLNSRQAEHCRLRVLDGNGSERWHVDLPESECTVHSISDPTIADYDRDGRREIVAATSLKTLVAYDLRTGEKELEHRLTSLGYSQPIVTNVTGAPAPETLVADLLGGVFALDANGTELWTRKFPDARVRQPAVADFDADGAPELVIGQIKGRVVLLENDGRTAWRTDLSDVTSVKWMTTGQADGDAPREMVLTTFSGTVIALDGANGAVQWRRDFDATGATVHSLGDGDGDGQAEVYVAARDGVVRSLDAGNGTVEWTTTLTTEESVVGPPPTLGDVDGDPASELVAVSNAGVVSIVDPETGEMQSTYEREVPINTYPRLKNLDADPEDEIVVIYDDGSVAVLSAT